MPKEHERRTILRPQLNIFINSHAQRKGKKKCYQICDWGRKYHLNEAFIGTGPMSQDAETSHHGVRPTLSWEMQCTQDQFQEVCLGQTLSYHRVDMAITARVLSCTCQVEGIFDVSFDKALSYPAFNALVTNKKGNRYGKV